MIGLTGDRRRLLPGCGIIMSKCIFVRPQPMEWGTRVLTRICIGIGTGCGSWGRSSQVGSGIEVIFPRSVLSDECRIYLLAEYKSLIMGIIHKIKANESL